MRISLSHKTEEKILKIADKRGITSEHRPFDAQSIPEVIRDKYLRLVRTIAVLADEEVERLGL